jgi:ribosomal protein S18 acetylase RimI-like enzyme
MRGILTLRGECHTGRVRIRRAEPSDEAAIVRLVERAYEGYVGLIGMRPGPMDDDYVEKVRLGLVHVAEEGQPVPTGESGPVDDPKGAGVIGLIVLIEVEDRLLIENVAVDPARQGEGIGRRLLAFAEDGARELGIDTLVLYTHEMMVENLNLYRRLGYEESERRAEAGFSRVFLSKRL